jgi:uncharacterized protein (TIGR03086 family)
MPYDSSVVVPLPPDETFALITQPERLRRWNNIAARIDVRAGGEYRWNIVPGAYVTGTIKEVEPGRRVVFGWGPEGEPDLADGSTVTITLEPTHDGTIVRVVHAGLPEDQEAPHAQGWDHYLNRLVLAGTDGDAGPDNWIMTIGSWENLDEQLAAEATLAVVLRVLRQINAGDLDNRTPCAKFTIAQVAEHLAGSIKGLGGLAGAEFGATETGVLEVDIADLAQPALEAWAKRGTDGIVGEGERALPAAYALGIFSVEFLVHAWDFAEATGQKIEVDDKLSEYVLGLSQRVVGEDMRRPEADMFGPELDAGPDASGLEQLLAFTGRAA